ncbi:hypothetical protein SUGI_1164720 [Cryptomeria japonica]|nr:hypothetical protein SUGI_1164720 [Cryptomeria japonica]
MRWIKLNFDGEAKGNPARAGDGGLFKDDRGQPLGMMEKCKGGRDSKIVINKMNGCSSNNWRLEWLLEDCKRLALLFDNIKFSHIKREGNKVADWAANRGIVLDDGDCYSLGWEEMYLADVLRFKTAAAIH